MKKYYKVGVFILSLLVIQGFYTSIRVEQILANKNEFVHFNKYWHDTDNLDLLRKVLWKCVWYSANFNFQWIELNNYTMNTPPTFNVFIWNKDTSSNGKFSGIMVRINSETLRVVETGEVQMFVSWLPETDEKYQ